MMLKKTLAIVNGKANYAVKDLDSWQSYDYG